MATIRICNEVGCQRKHKARGMCASHYNATPERRATIARCHNAARKERAESRSKTTAAPTLVLVPGKSQPDLEARQRHLMRAMVKSAKETTTWDGLQYLADLLRDAGRSA